MIPIAVGLLGPNGDEVRATQVLEMTQSTQSFVFEGLAAKPTPSILREFSAPVILQRDSSATERAILLAHDTDPFNRWEAGNALAKETRLAMITADATPDANYLEALRKLACDDALDPGFRALVLQPPGASDLAQTLFEQSHTPDPQAIYDTNEAMAQAVAQILSGDLERLYAATTVQGDYRPDAQDAGKRMLNARVLSLLTRLDGGAQAEAQYAAADNMTLQNTALNCLLSNDKGTRESQAFFDQWQGDRLVMDKWFGAQVVFAKPAKTAAAAAAMTQHALFDMKNPNRFRAVMGALVMNHAGFHHVSGAGYALLTDWLIKLDPINPQTTARMCSAFQTWKRYDAPRQEMIKAQLDRIAAQPDLSRDTTEMITRIREA